MATKNLAKKLGLLRQRSQNSSESKKSVISNQIFSYLIVIDFESTCWREKNNYGQEIIEFPAVLLDTSTGEVESEFHTYVQPQEHPILSEFCTELTGITQVQVEAGIPLQICLSRFNRWLQSLQLEKGVTFPNRQKTCVCPLASQKLCTFLTWSDWDLGVCLQYECKRKQLHKPEVLNSWIDLRSTYRLFYNKKPKGLNGALQDLGIQFSGREHSGLDDARNTARLAVRMMKDGCVMKITRSLEKTPAMVKATYGNNICPEENKKEKTNMNKKENVHISELLSANILFRDGQKRSCPKNIQRNLARKENSSSVPTCHSLVSPKTLLNNSKETLWGQNSRTDAAQTAASPSATFTVKGSHVLCSTTVSCFSHLPQPNQTFSTGLLDEEEETEVLVETEERCSSYDDVVLEYDYGINDTDKEWNPESVPHFDGECCEWGGHSRSAEVIPLEDHVGGHASRRRNPTMQHNVSNSSLISTSVRTNKTKKHSTTLGLETNFAVPRVVDWSKLNQSNTGRLASPQLQLKLGGPNKSVQTNLVSSVCSKPFWPEKTSTPNTSTTRHKPTITKQTEPLKSPFTVYTETKKQATRSSHSFGQTPNNVLSSLSTNTLSSWASRKGPQKITSPLCACGRRAKRQVVSNGGPNQGRGFYCCSVRRSGGRGRMEKRCEFFKWESALMKSSSVDLSSMSLCQVNSTLPHLAPTRKSY